jgi:hypothetical protein
MSKRSQEPLDEEDKSDEVEESDSDEELQRKLNNKYYPICGPGGSPVNAYDREESEEESEEDESEEEDDDDDDDGGGKPPAKETPPVPPLEIPRAPVPAPVPAPAAKKVTTIHDAATLNLNQPYDLSLLNPEPNIDETVDVAYEPPELDADMGPLQLFYEQQTFKEKDRRAYILLVAGQEFKCNLLVCEPYASYQNESQKKKSGNKFKTLKTTKKMIGIEMKRRDPAARPNTGNKNTVQLIAEFFSPHLDLTDSRDKLYVRYMERCLRQEIKEQLQSIKATPTVARPIYCDRMRFVLCFEHDEEIVKEYKLLQIALTRPELDARNSNSVKEKQWDFYRLICAKFNDSSWIPKNKIYSQMHEDFAVETEYPKREEFDLDYGKCKNILDWVKGKLNTIIRNYNASGNGSANVAEEYQVTLPGDDNVDEVANNKKNLYGYFDIEQANLEGGDDRRNFLNGMPSDLLYWWQVMQDLDILQATCVVFNREFAASSHEMPKPIAELQREKKLRNKAKKRKMDDVFDGFEKSNKQMHADMKSLLSERQKERIEELHEKLDEKKTMELSIAEKLYSNDVPSPLKERYKKRLKELENSIEKLEAELEEIENK